MLFGAVVAPGNALSNPLWRNQQNVYRGSGFFLPDKKKYIVCTVVANCFFHSGVMLLYGLLLVCQSKEILHMYHIW